MKTISITIGITSIFVMFFQTYLISGIYAINEETNTTMDIDTANLTESAAIGVAGDVASIYKFKEIIAEGKSTLLNVLDIKTNTPIKYNTIACISGFIYASGIKVEELACDEIGVVEDGVFQDRKTPAVSLSLLTALNQGIEKPIKACYKYTSAQAEGRTSIFTLDCNTLFILYK